MKTLKALVKELESDGIAQYHSIIFIDNEYFKEKYHKNYFKREKDEEYEDWKAKITPNLYMFDEEISDNVYNSFYDKIANCALFWEEYNISSKMWIGDTYREIEGEIWYNTAKYLNKVITCKFKHKTATKEEINAFISNMEFPFFLKENEWDTDTMIKEFEDWKAEKTGTEPSYPVSLMIPRLLFMKCDEDALRKILYETLKTKDLKNKWLKKNDYNELENKVYEHFFGKNIREFDEIIKHCNETYDKILSCENRERTRNITSQIKISIFEAMRKEILDKHGYNLADKLDKFTEDFFKQKAEEIAETMNAICEKKTTGGMMLYMTEDDLYDDCITWGDVYMTNMKCKTWEQVKEVILSEIKKELL